MNTPLKNNLKSLLARIENDPRAGLMFEADGDTLREAITLCDLEHAQRMAISTLDEEITKCRAIVASWPESVREAMAVYRPEELKEGE